MVQLILTPPLSHKLNIILNNYQSHLDPQLIHNLKIILDSPQPSDCKLNHTDQNEHHVQLCSLDHQTLIQLVHSIRLAGTVSSSTFTLFFLLLLYTYRQYIHWEGSGLLFYVHIC